MHGSDGGAVYTFCENGIEFEYSSNGSPSAFPTAGAFCRSRVNKEISKSVGYATPVGGVYPHRLIRNYLYFQ